MEGKGTTCDATTARQCMPWWRKGWIIMLALLVVMLILLLCLRLAGCCGQSKVPVAPTEAAIPAQAEEVAPVEAPAVEALPEVEFDLSKLKPVAWSVADNGYVESASAFNESFERQVVAAREAMAEEVLFPIAAVRYDIRDYDVCTVESELVSAVANAFLKTNQQGTLLVEGYTCNVGSDAYNEKLSRQRAERVSSLLKKSGLAADKVETKWYGASKYGQLPGVTELEAHRRVTITVK